MSQPYALNQTKFLSDAELSELKRVLKLFSITDQRNVLAIELLLATGARAQELLNLTKADLNSADKSIFIRGIKGSNDREIPLHKSLYGRIFMHTAESQPSDRLFPITYPRLVQIWNDYKPGPKSIKSTRHTFALNLYKKTKDLRLVSVALGHRNIQNTMIYASYHYSQSELRKLIL